MTEGFSGKPIEQYPTSVKHSLIPQVSEKDKEITRLRAENERLREALTRIAERHIPDQPASSGQDEADYVRNHYAQLRWIAKCAAIEGVTEKSGAGNE